MNVEDAQNFVSNMVDFCKDNLIYGELAPMDTIQELDIRPEDIVYIKKFVEKNPIVITPSNPRYKKSINFSGHKFLNVSYITPEGLMWKDQIFMPTWILTTIILARVVRDLGAKSAFDLGAGDARLQYFSSSIGLRSYGIEYSKELTDIQKQIAESTGVELGTIKGDALQKRDYSIYRLEKPAFFISLVGKERKRAFDCLKSSLNEYTPDLLKESLFVTIHYRNNNSSKNSIFESEKLLNEIYNLQLPTFWDKEANYRISKL